MNISEMGNETHFLRYDSRVRDGIYEERSVLDGKAGEWHPVDLKYRFDLWHKTYSEEEGHPPDQKLVLAWWGHWVRYD